MIRSSLCDCSDRIIYVKGTLTIPNTETAEAQENKNKNVIFRNCASFNNSTCEINKTQVDDAHDTDVVISMYSLIKYSDIYLKTSESLRQYYRD